MHYVIIYIGLNNLSDCSNQHWTSMTFFKDKKHIFQYLFFREGGKTQPLHILWPQELYSYVCLCRETHTQFHFPLVWPDLTGWISFLCQVIVQCFGLRNNLS